MTEETETHVASTRMEALQVLSHGGQPLHQFHAQMTEHLRRVLGPDHATLFAEPTVNHRTFTADWYVGVAGTPQRLDELPAATRARVEDRLSELVADVAAEADRLRASGRDAERMLGDVLRAALEIPGESHVHAVGEQPVLTCWGALESGPEARQSVLQEYVGRVAASRAAGPPADTTAPVDSPETVPPETVAAVAERGGEDIPGVIVVARDEEERGFPWLAAGLWLLAALLALFLGFLLLQACGLATPGTQPWWQRVLVSYCPDQGAPEVGAAAPTEEPGTAARRAALLTEIEVLRRQVLQAAARCPAAPPGQASGLEPTPRPEPPPEPAPEAPVDGEEDAASTRQRIEEESGRIGHVNIVLEWNSVDDLDLHVKCPNGQEIFYRNKRACGGHLDVDRNAGRSQTRRPIENIIWEQGAMAPGRYRIAVRYYKARPPLTPVPFKVKILIDGEIYEKFERTVRRASEVVEIYTLNMPVDQR